jgi:hypothetical protein
MGIALAPCDTCEPLHFLALCFLCGDAPRRGVVRCADLRHERWQCSLVAVVAVAALAYRDGSTSSRTQLAHKRHQHWWHRQA